MKPNGSSNGTRLRWSGSFQMLQVFVECGLKMHGDWSSPGSSAKKFTCVEVVNTASDMPTGSPNKSLKNDVYAEKPKVRSNSYSCNVVHNFEHGCQCGILVADLKGIKLDMVIMQKVLESKISAVD